MRKNRAVSFLALVVIIAITSLLLIVAIERIVKISITQNESQAAATLKLISTALENYAQDHQGLYPESIAILRQESPPYLDKDYLAESPVRGYEYSCLRLEPSGYSCFAVPLKCRITGKEVISITTGGSLEFEECSK